MSELSRRKLLSAAAVPVAIAPAFAAPVVYSATEDEHKLLTLADEIQKAWDDLGDELRNGEPAASDALWCRIEDATDAVSKIPARSLRALAAKARVADVRLRCNGVPHSEGDYAWWVIDFLALEGAA